MLILISPAKTLDYQSPLATERYTQPELLDYSQQLIREARKLSAPQIASLMSISDKLAGKHTLHIDPETLTLLAARALDLLAALQTRGHAAQADIQMHSGKAPWPAAKLPAELNKARSQPKWSSLNTREPEQSRRDRAEAAAVPAAEVTAVGDRGEVAVEPARVAERASGVGSQTVHRAAVEHATGIAECVAQRADVAHAVEAVHCLEEIARTAPNITLCLDAQNGSIQIRLKA